MHTGQFMNKRHNTRIDLNISYVFVILKDAIMKSTVKWILIVLTYVYASFGLVEGWSCPSMSKLYRRGNDDVTLRYKVTATTINSAYTVYSYNTYLGSIVIYTGGVIPSPVKGINISGDVTGNINVTIPKVQVSSAGIYRIESTTAINQCLFLYILGKPTPMITSNKNPTVGENVILTCSSTSTTVPSNHSLSMKYTWKINNADVPANTRYILSNTGATLTVVNVNKTDAHSRFTCTAQEDISQAYLSDISNYFAINVLYPPDGRPIIGNYVNGDTYSVIDNTTGTLPCTIKGGNPRPTLSWTCYNQAGAYTYPDNQTVTRTVAWTATRGTDSTCTCRCPEAVSGQQSTYVNVKLLYPPSTPSFTINSQTVSGTNIKVIRGKSFTVTCNSSSEPVPGSYTWKRPDGSSLVSQILTDNNVQTSHNGQYSCKVENTMSPSSGGTVTGSADRDIQLLVLYPPEIGELSNRSIVEGSMLQLPCSYTAGSPAETTLKWTRSGDQRVWNTQQLTISNISRTDGMMYTCTIYNTMNPTNEIEVKGERSGSFHLNVLFKTSITSFYIQGYENKETITVDEAAVVDFTCHVTSNPESRISVLFHDKIIKSVTGSAVSHTTNAVSCLHTGIYKCSGQNDYNAGIPSVKIMTMYVQYKPDPPTVFVSTGNHLSKVTVQWKPGFDGGLRQTFILRYKRDNDVDWKEVEIADTQEEMMTYTISDLSPGTSYHIVIYARNDIGNSSLSAILFLKTTGEKNS